MFTSRAEYVGPVLNAVFLRTSRPIAPLPAYLQFAHSRTTPNSFKQNKIYKIQEAGGLYGDASRPDCERFRNQRAFGSRAHATAQNCGSRSARTFPPASRAGVHRTGAQPGHDPIRRVYLEA